MSNVRYADVYSSLLRFTHDFSEDLNTRFNLELKPFNFDTVGDVSRLPNENFFGFSDWSLENTDSKSGLEIPLYVGFSVLMDMNFDLLENILLNELVSHMAKQHSDSTIKIYRANQLNEEILGEMTFSKNFKVMPTRHFGSRSFKMVDATLLCPKNIGY